MMDEPVIFPEGVTSISGQVVQLPVKTKSASPVNIMVDTETWGLQENAIILSIGAVVFNPLTGEQFEEFYVEIDPSKYPGGVDISTIKFWMEQSLAGTPCPCNGTEDIGTALTKFVQFLGVVSEDNLERVVLWANGTDFDIPKLQYAFRACQAQAPWKYNAVRDCRTIFSIFGDKGYKYGLKPAANTQKHNALADAKWQAAYLSSILRNLHEQIG